MSTHTPEFFARRGIRLTPTGEAVVIAGTAVLALAWIASLVLATAIVADALGGGSL